MKDPALPSDILVLIGSKGDSHRNTQKYPHHARRIPPSDISVKLQDIEWKPTHHVVDNEIESTVVESVGNAKIRSRTVNSGETMTVITNTNETPLASIVQSCVLLCATFLCA